MRSPRWIDPRALLLLHVESLAEYGGPPGVRDEGALAAAVARPQHIHACETDADIARLAAAYGFGIVRGHPFTDGNKRPGFLAIGLFLSLNGFALVVDQVDAIETIMALAAGRLREGELATWIRKHTVRAK